MLACPDCGAVHEAGPREPWRCDCGHPLSFADQPLPDGPPGDLDRRRGIGAFEGFLPDPLRVTLGEGFTPEVDAPAWGARAKLEYVSPTGSFKDRGAATTVSRAAALGVERLVEDSSGNAGAAIATYAARAGIDAGIYVPADATPAKRAAIERAGAEVIPVEGSREDVSRACIAAVEDGDAWYASHARHPAFLAGTATFAYEAAADRGWAAPDAVVLPVGHGTLFLGAHRGFRALRDAGWTDRVPRLLGAQAAGYAPIAAELHGGGGGRNDLADGIRIREPARRGELLDAVAATDGDVIAVEEATTRDALDRLRRAGFGVEPTCAVAPAALERYRERGVVDACDDVLVALTGRAK